MTKQAIIERTIKAINQLPEDKAVEISDFADLLLKSLKIIVQQKTFSNWLPIAKFLIF